MKHPRCDFLFQRRSPRGKLSNKYSLVEIINRSRLRSLSDSLSMIIIPFYWLPFMFLSLCCMFYWSHFNLTTLWSSCSHLCFINEARGAWRGSEACLRSHRYCGALTHAHLCAVWDYAHSLWMPPSLSCTLSKDAMPTLSSHICRMEPSNHTGIDNLPCLQHGIFYSQWYCQVGKKL